ncbi:hypothetical protein Syun_004139 [Stephania yunnanensis]|uniref:Uncharacterized protein n=1 Tax=Stephania yunnanensis TaxID=152371 RepID=A0AAP0Q0H2_9MAGN
MHKQQPLNLDSPHQFVKRRIHKIRDKNKTHIPRIFLSSLSFHKHSMSTFLSFVIRFLGQ